MPAFGAKVCSMRRPERVQRAEPISQACTARRHTRKQYSTTVHIIGRNTLHPAGDEERKSAEPSII